MGQGTLNLWGAKGPTEPETPKNSKQRESNKKVTLGVEFLSYFLVTFSLLRNARLFIILFVRNFWRVCSQFWLSVRNSVWGPCNRNSGGNPSLCWLGGGGVNWRKNCEKNILWTNWHFLVTFRPTPQVTFSVLFRDFDFCGVSGSVGPFAPHNPKLTTSWQSTISTVLAVCIESPGMRLLPLSGWRHPPRPCCLLCNTICLIAACWKRWRLIRNGKAAQRGSFRAGYPADIWGSFARISRTKTSVRALETLGKQANWRGHPWREGADVRDPKGFPKTSVRKTLGWIFVP